MKHFMPLCCVFLLAAIFSSMGCDQPVHSAKHPLPSHKPKKNKPSWSEREYFHKPKEIALCRAIEKQDIATIDKLVAEGVDVNAKGDDGMRFLTWAFPAPKSFQSLLEHGADPNFAFENDFKLCGAKFYKGDTILMLVSEKSCPTFREYLPLLLKYGADPNAGNIPPLYLACSRAYEDKDIEMIRQLVEAGADLNASDSPRDIYYIVSNCALLERYKVLLYLLECGAEYRPHTKPGGQMQRFLLENRQECDSVLKKLASGEWTPKTELEKKSAAGFAPRKAECEKVISWLEKHGVSFDKPIPESESQERPKPFYFKPPKNQKKDLKPN